MRTCIAFVLSFCLVCLQSFADAKNTLPTFAGPAMGTTYRVTLKAHISDKSLGEVHREIASGAYTSFSGIQEADAQVPRVDAHFLREGPLGARRRVRIAGLQAGCHIEQRRGISYAAGDEALARTARPALADRRTEAVAAARGRSRSN